METADPASPPRPLRLAIVDADHRVRDSLAALVGSGDEITVIGAVGHASAAMDLVAEGDPDVVILDPKLPEVDMGLGFLAELRRRWPGIGVLVMSWTDALETTCLELGANGFVRKTSGPSDLVEAILAVGPRRERPKRVRPAALTAERVLADAQRGTGSGGGRSRRSRRECVR